MKKQKYFIKSSVALLKAEKKIPISNLINVPELLKGKVALITGDSGGIGFAMAESFIKSGSKIITAGTNEKNFARVTKKTTRIIHSD